MCKRSYTSYYFSELYYQLANSKQKKCAQVWSAVNEISRILDVGPWEFAVFKTSKGLVYGELNIFYANDEVINCNVTGGMNKKVLR